MQYRIVVSIIHLIGVRMSSLLSYNCAVAAYQTPGPVGDLSWYIVSRSIASKLSRLPVAKILSASAIAQA